MLDINSQKVVLTFAMCKTLKYSLLCTFVEVHELLITFKIIPSLMLLDSYIFSKFLVLKVFEKQATAVMIGSRQSLGPQFSSIVLI